ncbi:GIY-YIG nuclease family protein [Alkalicella caledoniensis]|uniref:GIY-YIG nuclease family protein n=1 Tax=Alkalicella caledoniensis TaxID=2731377 RepID=A0A7G9WCY9_ALKCA|nr:GIY-YIG nuclease family protein [Alkalicella caledoniensis]QNO16551.1 GIY-YIG nuclease family protein [Alkalicella caledoniensis]
MLKDKLNDVPHVPGVYFMKDGYGNIIYVGKSKCLNKRVRQYFNKSSNHSDKIIEMVSRIEDFEVHVTDTEFDALLYENEMIKKLAPMYNSKLKKFKGYPYIKILKKGRDSKVFITSDFDSTTEGLYFGPFTSKGTVEEALEFIKSHFGLRMCNRPSNKGGGCLNHQLNRCDGLCRVDIESSIYDERIDQVVNFLLGKDRAPVRILIEQMQSAAENLYFEKADVLKRQLTAVQHILRGGEVLKFAGKYIVVLESLGDSKYKVFMIHGNKVLYSEVLCIDDDWKDKLCNSILEVFSFSSTSISTSNSMEKSTIDTASIIYSYLHSKNERLDFTILPKICIKSRDLERIKVELNKLILRLDK